jgi:hypothetical protein
MGPKGIEQPLCLAEQRLPAPPLTLEEGNESLKSPTDRTAIHGFVSRPYASDWTS